MKLLVVVLGISVYYNVSLLIDQNRLNDEITQIENQVEDLLVLNDELVDQIENGTQEDASQNDDSETTCLKLYEITITVINEVEEFESSTTHCTNETTLGGALDEIAVPLSVVFDPRYSKDYVYGRLVHSFYGFSKEEMEYYAITVDGVYASYGVDLLELIDGAEYTFTLTGWS